MQGSWALCSSQGFSALTAWLIAQVPTPSRLPEKIKRRLFISKTLPLKEAWRFSTFMRWHSQRIRHWLAMAQSSSITTTTAALFFLPNGFSGLDHSKTLRRQSRRVARRSRAK